MKVTETLQVLPGFKVFLHWLFTANGGEVVSPVIDTLIFELFELVFLIVRFFGLLFLPGDVLLPKLTVLGLNDSVPIGVGVAVGVAVAVRVGVAVAVRVPEVAVAVGVGVAVLVGVAVFVGVPPVAVGVGVGVRDAVAVAVGVGVPPVGTFNDTVSIAKSLQSPVQLVMLKTTCVMLAAVLSRTPMKVASPLASLTTGNDPSEVPPSNAWIFAVN